MSRAGTSGIHLTEADAAIVKGMLNRGDRQHDIAAWFGVNGGRIAEIATGDRFAGVKASTTNLPPPGPYMAARVSYEAKVKLSETEEKLSEVLEEIKQIKKDIS